MLKSVIAFVFSGLVLFSSGCAMLQEKIQEPKVNLQKVDVGTASASDATLIFNFLVENPNPVPLNLDQVDYNIDLNGKAFTNGVLEQGLKVGANSSVQVPLPIKVKYSDVFNSLSDLLSKGSTPYEIRGAVKMGFLSVPFKQNGQIDLKEVAK